MTVTPEYTDVAGIATYLGRTPKAVRRLVERRQIPHVRVGRKLQFKVSTVLRWMDGHRRNGSFIDFGLSKAAAAHITAGTVRINPPWDELRVMANQMQTEARKCGSIRLAEFADRLTALLTTHTE